MKTEAKKFWYFSLPLICCDQFSSLVYLGEGYTLTFLFEFLYLPSFFLSKPFLLFVASLSKFRSSFTLVFLSLSLHKWTSSHTLRRLPVLVSTAYAFVPFPWVWTSRFLLSHAFLLLSLPNFLLLRIANSCSLRQLPSVFLPCTWQQSPWESLWLPPWRGESFLP